MANANDAERFVLRFWKGPQIRLTADGVLREDCGQMQAGSQIQKRKRGNQPVITAEIATGILAMLGEGKMLPAICKHFGIGLRTVHDFRDNNPAFAALYARERERGYEALAAECVEIADDQTDEPNSRRVRVETRRWLLSKWCPQRYGDNLQVQHSGEIDIVIKIGGIERKIETANYSRS